MQRRTPAQEEHVPRVAVLDLVEVRAPFVDDDVGANAHALQLRGDGEREVLVERIAPRRRIEREAQRFWIDAGLLEQRLGARRIVLVALHRGIVDVGRRQRPAHARRAALEDLLDQLIDIDGVIHGAAHADVLHRAGLEIDEREVVDA